MVQMQNVLKSTDHDSIKFENLAALFDNAVDRKIRIEIALNYVKLAHHLLSSSDSNQTKLGIIHVGYSLYNMARLKEQEIDLADAVNLYLAGAELYKMIGYRRGISDHYNSIAMIYNRTGRYDIALDYYFKALEIDLERNSKADLAYLYNNIGTVYNELEDRVRAKEYFMKALEITDTKEPSHVLFLIYSNLGSLRVQQHIKDSSFYYCFKGLEVAKKLNLKREISVIYNNIATNFNHFKQTDSADYYLDLSIEAAKSGDDIYKLSQLYKNKAVTAYKQGKTQEIEKYATESYNLAIKYRLPENLRTVSEFLATYYKEKKNYEKATFFNELYIKMNDSLYNEEKRKQVLTKQMEFEFKLRENKLIADQEKREIISGQEKKQQIFIRNIFLSGFVLMIIISLYIYSNYRNKKKANELISSQKEQLQQQHILLSEKQKEILDSIEYAKRLQQAILAPENNLKTMFNDAFIIYLPKDIVSGDFYWMAESPYNKIISVADCTGHGVPGGFMSMLGYEMLQEVLLKEQITTTSMALKILDKKMTEALSKSGSTYRDGMDISLAAFSKTKNVLQFSGANRPLLKISDGILTEIKPDKFTIGGDIDGTEKKYTNHEIPYKPGDIFYLFSDGYADQFGGDNNKKFSFRKFKEYLHLISDKTAFEQKELLTDKFYEWKKDYEQIDDVCLIGIIV